MATIPLPSPGHEADFAAPPAAAPSGEPAALFQREPAHALHGFEQAAPNGSEPWRKRLAWLRNLALLVLLPTLAVAIFEYGIVANQYESETHFVIRTAGQSGSTNSG
ncbi:hypothetical protein GY972_23145, partial [Escherichia coli]